MDISIDNVLPLICTRCIIPSDFLVVSKAIVTKEGLLKKNTMDKYHGYHQRVDFPIWDCPTELTKINCYYLAVSLNGLHNTFIPVSLFQSNYCSV